MVKTRMSGADVAAEVACLRAKILGLRVANVYDINAKVCAVICAVMKQVDTLVC